MLFLLVGTVGFINTKAEIYYRLIVFCFGLLGVSYLWTQISLDGIEIKAKNRSTKAKVGQIFEETAQIINHSKIPKLFIEINDASDLFAKSGSRLITWIGAGQSRTLTTRIKLSKRGNFEVGSKLLRSGDPIGFFVKEEKFVIHNHLLVLPHYYDIQTKEPSPQIIKNGRSIQKRSLEPSVQFSEVRNYAPGDDYKRIHWLSSKKLNKLMVKEFEQYLHNEYWILLDSSSKNHFAGEDIIESTDPWVFVKKEKVQLPQDSFEYGVTIAATLCHQLLRKERAVGLVSESHGNIRVQQDTGSRQEKKIFDSLALISPKGGKNIETVINQNSRLFLPGCKIFIITSLNDDSLFHGVTNLLERKITPLIFMLEPGSFAKFTNSFNQQNQMNKFPIPICPIKYNSDLKSTMEQFINSNLES